MTYRSQCSCLWHIATITIEVLRSICKVSEEEPNLDSTSSPVHEPTSSFRVLEGGLLLFDLPVADSEGTIPCGIIIAKDGGNGMAASALMAPGS